MEKGCNGKLTWPAEAFSLIPGGGGNQRKTKAREGGSTWSRRGVVILKHNDLLQD